MSTDKGKEKIVPGLFDSIEDVLFNVAQGIARSQMFLDQNSISTQIAIDNEEALSKYGFEAPWYNFAETEVELKLAIHLADEKKELTIGKKKVLCYKPRIMIAPLNANYAKKFNYDAAFSSTIKTKIVPIPPQIRAISEQG